MYYTNAIVLHGLSSVHALKNLGSVELGHLTVPRITTGHGEAAFSHLIK